jgi:hypothetical protein
MPNFKLRHYLAAQAKETMMALTQAHLDALDQAIGAGVLRARYPDGSEVQFDSFQQLRARRDWVAGQLQAGTVGSQLGGRRVTVASF